MVEIARAFTVTDAPAQVVILDEPTSSLDSVLAGQLLAHVRRFTAGGGSVILISHLLGEVLGDRRPDRGDARRPGRGARPRRRLRPRRRSSGPWAASEPARPRRGRASRGARATPAPVVRARPRGRATRASSSPTPARSSASAGSSGHGQTELLVQVFDRADGAEVAGAGGARRRRPAERRHLPALVDRREHRRSARSAASSPGRCSTRAASAPSPRTGGSASASARPTSATRSCRCPAATSRRCCSPARSAPTRASS